MLNGSVRINGSKVSSAYCIRGGDFVELWEIQTKAPKPVHRLDSPTSGLIIVAKSIPARIELGKMLEHKQVEKTYCALLCGKLEEKNEIQFSIEGNEAKTKVFPSEFKKSLNNEYITKVFMQPITGRTR